MELPACAWSLLWAPAANCIPRAQLKVKDGQRWGAPPVHAWTCRPLNTAKNSCLINAVFINFLEDGGLISTRPVLGDLEGPEAELAPPTAPAPLACVYSHTVCKSSPACHSATRGEGARPQEHPQWPSWGRDCDSELLEGSGAEAPAKDSEDPPAVGLPHFSGMCCTHSQNVLSRGQGCPGPRGPGRKESKRTRTSLCLDRHKVCPVPSVQKFCFLQVFIKPPIPESRGVFLGRPGRGWDEVVLLGCWDPRHPGNVHTARVTERPLHSHDHSHAHGQGPPRGRGHLLSPLLGDMASGWGAELARQGPESLLLQHSLKTWKEAGRGAEEKGCALRAPWTDHVTRGGSRILCASVSSSVK